MTTATNPTARDVETARALSPCWYATPDEPGATCNGVGAPDCCAECQIAERIARALATARAEEREANCRAVCQFCHGDDGGVSQHAVEHEGRWWHQIEGSAESELCGAAAIRAARSAS